MFGGNRSITVSRTRDRSKINDDRAAIMIVWMSMAHGFLPAWFMAEGMFRLAAMADLHYGSNSRGKYASVFSQIGQTADALLLCGDLVDNGLRTEAQVLVSAILRSRGNNLAEGVRDGAGTLRWRRRRSPFAKPMVRFRLAAFTGSLSRSLAGAADPSDLIRLRLSRRANEDSELGLPELARSTGTGILRLSRRGTCVPRNVSLPLAVSRGY